MSSLTDMLSSAGLYLLGATGIGVALAYALVALGWTIAPFWPLAITFVACTLAYNAGNFIMKGAFA